MNLADILGFVGVVLIVLAGGVLAAAEAAIAHVSPSRIESLAEGGLTNADRLRRVLERQDVARDTLMLLRLVAIQGAAVIAGVILLRWLEDVWLWLVIPALSVVTFVLMSLVRRALLAHGPEGLALAAAGMVLRSSRVLGPVVKALTRPSSWIGRGREELPAGVDVREILDQASGGEGIEEEEARMLTSVISFTDTIVRDVMVPRPDMVCLGAAATIEEALTLAVDTGFSRIPVYGDGFDDMLGLLYVKDLLKKPDEREPSAPIAGYLRPAKFVPEQKRTTDLLADMRSEKFHMALVVDEYGGTAGLVTLEDLLEELVGEIEDEYDAGEELIHYRGDGAYRVVGRYPLSDLEQVLGTRIEVEDAATVGGAMLALMGRIPEVGDKVTHPGSRITFRAVRVRGHRVEEVDVLATEEPETPVHDGRRASGDGGQDPAAAVRNSARTHRPGH